MDYPIVDTHLHVWDPDLLRYRWLEDVPLLNQSYLPEDYRAACGTVEVEAMVFIQAEVDHSQFREEAQWVSRLAREEDPRIKGIVAWAPLEKGDAAQVDLEALAQDPLIKGIRRIIQSEPDPEFCLRPGFLQGVQALPDSGLHFEIAVARSQRASAIEMVARCPEVTFMLDHIGNPDIKNHHVEPWKSELRALAEFPNVWCKMSGLATQADHAHWTKEDLRPYIDHTIDCFGFDRVAYGGDWPVARLATEYPRWVQTLEWAVSGCSDEEMEDLFHKNAKAFYRLE